MSSSLDRGVTRTKTLKHINEIFIEFFYKALSGYMRFKFFVKVLIFYHYKVKNLVHIIANVFKKKSKKNPQLLKVLVSTKSPSKLELMLILLNYT